MNTARTINNKKKKRRNKAKKRNAKKLTSNDISNYWNDLEEALNSCHIVHLMPPDFTFSNVDKDTETFIDRFNSQKKFWEINNIARLTYNDEMLSRGKVIFPISFKEIFDFYNKHNISIHFSLIKSKINYWENPDLGTVLNSNIDIISVHSKDNSFIEIPLKRTESCNIFVLTFTGMRAIVAFTHPFTLLYMKSSVNMDNKLTVI